MSRFADYYTASVLSAERLTPSMIRIRFGGADLRRFVSSGQADERVSVIFPLPGQARPPQPTLINGIWSYPDEATRPQFRSYTVRRWDPAAPEMIIDFVVHEGGVAAQWALRAAPGDEVGLTMADGWYAPPVDAGWQLLVADLTGLPAAGRIIEELTPGDRVHAIIEVIDPADEQRFETRGDVTYQWLHRSGHGLTESRLPEAVRGYERPAGPGYLWFAGEAGASRTVRKFVRGELGWSADRFEIIGYWRHRKEEWLARFDAVRDEMAQALDHANTVGTNRTEVRELYDDALERVGL
ncbi:siderophore-interacting protein [Microlunatus sp. GCM10028923]|uniref:siderophore-interacting protein n=1 Tax=Microlunatus sp. GCM10028923 TaxID=3273400 RepID=UPI003605BFE7